MAEAGRNLTDLLFGPSAAAPASMAPPARVPLERATPASVEQWRRTLSLDDLEQQYNLPAGLMTSVLRQESGGDPRIKSFAGAQGLFQFMPKTAAAYKIDPFDPQQAAPAAAKELSTLYKKYGGDVDRTLAAWNWGQGNVDRKGMANMPSETRGFLTNVKRFLTEAPAPQMAQAQSPAAAPPPSPPAQEPPTILARMAKALSPASAEAATGSPGRNLTPQMTPAPASGGRNLTDRLVAPPSPETPPQSPQVAPGQATPTPPVSSPQEAAAAVARLRAKPETRQAMVLEELRQWEQQKGRPWREGDPRMPSEKTMGLPDEPPLQEGFTEPSTLLPLVTGGLGARAVGGVMGESVPLAQRLARPVVEGLSQTLGWGTGKTIETGAVPSPAALGKEAAFNVATGGLVEIPGAVSDATRAVMRSTPGAQTVLKDQAVREAENLGQRVFGSEEKAVVSKMFDDIAATGVKLDVLPVHDLWSSLTTVERQMAQRELQAISPRFATAVGNPNVRGWDIGDLQDLRSNLLKAQAARKNPATKDLLQALRSSVDEAIANGRAIGGVAAGSAPQDLIAAQKAWRKVRQAEDLQGLVTKHTKDSQNLKWHELNLAALNKDLRGGGSKAAKLLAGQMSSTERQALAQELESLARHYPFVRVGDTAAKWTGRGTLAGAVGLAATGHPVLAGGALLTTIVTEATRSPEIMNLFRKSLIDGGGRLSAHHVDTLMNAIRHEREDEQEPGTVRVTISGTGQ